MLVYIKIVFYINSLPNRLRLLVTFTRPVAAVPYIGNIHMSKCFPGQSFQKHYTFQTLRIGRK